MSAVEKAVEVLGCVRMLIPSTRPEPHYVCRTCRKRDGQPVDWSDRHASEATRRAEAVVAAVTPAIAAKAWDQGYTSGHSRAMRQMSDEPGVGPGTNPYQEAPRA